MTWNRTRRLSGWYAFLLAMAALLALLVPAAVPTTAQVGQGATMTVLSGSVAVIRTNGTAVQPAPSGTEVFPGDEIRTLFQSGALITFFAGTEIELGAETILVVQSVSRPGDRVDVTLRQVAGTSLSRVHTFIDSGGGYRVEAGGVVALIRGSELGVLGPRDGIVVFINLESTVPIMINRCILPPGVGIWVQVEPDGSGGWRVISECHEFRADLRGGVWNALEDGFTTAQDDLKDDEPKKKTKKDDDNPIVSTTTASGSTVTTTTSGNTVTVFPEVLVTTTRTSTAPVTVTTGATSTTVTTVTDSRTTTIPVTTTFTVTRRLTESTTSTTAVVTPTTSTTTLPVTTATTTTVPVTTVTHTTTTTTTIIFECCVD